MNRNIEIIKEQLLNHAIYFLENMETFYPFGMALFENNQIKFHGVEQEDLKRNPTIDEMTARISEKLFHYVEYEEALCIGIALDSEFSKKEISGKVNVIEIRILDENAEEYFVYCKYKLVNSKVIILGESNSPWIDLLPLEN
jgi:hypothetical protein